MTKLSLRDSCKALIQVIDTTLVQVKIIEATQGDAYFPFQQLTASVQWLIEHPLAKFASVSVVDHNGDEQTAHVHYVSDSTILLSFNRPVSGQAYLN